MVGAADLNAVFAVRGHEGVTESGADFEIDDIRSAHCGTTNLPPGGLMFLLSSAEMRECDRITIEEREPRARLMEQAGGASAEIGRRFDSLNPADLDRVRPRAAVGGLVSPAPPRRRAGEGLPDRRDRRIAGDARFRSPALARLSLEPLTPGA
jgi:hypothetical protein